MTRNLAFRATACALTVAAVLVVSRNSAAQRPIPDRAAAREQIFAILARWEGAWNTHDMATFGTLFHDDGIWVLWTGSVWSGRRAIQDGHAEVHKTVFRNSIQRELLEELTFVGPDAAVARFCSVLTGDERSPGEVVRSLKILVVTKRDGVWRVGWGQNTRLAPTVPDSECFASLRRKLGGA